MDKVGIIGAGSWGTALSLVLANNGHSVEIWSIVKEEIDMLKEKHEHVDKLPGVKLPDRVTFTTDLGSVIKNNDILVLAVPSVFTRSTAVKMAPFVKKGQIIVCVAKGIEEDTLMTISDVTEQEIPCADVAVIPSVREGFGMTGVEALASGVPVVGSDVQGIREYVIPGKTGYLCDPYDAHQFADAIEKIVNLPSEERAKMVIACKEKAKEFDVSKSIAAMKNIYQEVLCHDGK